MTRLASTMIQKYNPSNGSYIGGYVPTRLRIALHLARDTFTLERSTRRNATAETRFGTIWSKNLTHNAIRFAP
jgi:hypothetical protein